jgi:hypothetical protein
MTGSASESTTSSPSCWSLGLLRFVARVIVVEISQNFIVRISSPRCGRFQSGHASLGPARLLWGRADEIDGQVEQFHTLGELAGELVSLLVLPWRQQ